MHRLIANPFRLRPLLAVACLLATPVLFVPAPATSQPVPPVEPVETPEPLKPEPTPTAAEDLVVITGPTEAVLGGYFIVSIKAPVPSEDALVEVSSVAPAGASPPIELAGKSPGEVVYLYQQVIAGDYVFRAAAQISVDRSEGFDPHDEDVLKVVVKAPGPPVVTPGPVQPDQPGPVVPDEKATAATYVYEKDQHAIPGPVLGALNKLNRERGIIATAIEADTKDGTGEVPEQYKAALAAAKEAGLPVLVVTAGTKVLAIIKDPKTEQAVLEAVK